MSTPCLLSIIGLLLLLWPLSSTLMLCFIFPSSVQTTQCSLYNVEVYHTTSLKTNLACPCQGRYLLKFNTTFSLPTLLRLTWCRLMKLVTQPSLALKAGFPSSRVRWRLWASFCTIRLVTSCSCSCRWRIHSISSLSIARLAGFLPAPPTLLRFCGSVAMICFCSHHSRTRLASIPNRFATDLFDDSSVAAITSSLNSKLNDLCLRLFGPGSTLTLVVSVAASGSPVPSIFRRNWLFDSAHAY